MKKIGASRARIQKNSGKRKKGSIKRRLKRRGINLIGYIRAEMGIGEACRSIAKAIKKTGIPFRILNYPKGNPGRMLDFSWRKMESKRPSHNTNLFIMNPDSLLGARHYFGNALFKKRYNIGYWHWELPEFPDEWCKSFKWVQEIWVPTQFIKESVEKKAKVPVRVIPLAIEVGYDPHLNRQSFGLPQDRYLFLSMFDTNSLTQRKNPYAAVEAFQSAFANDDAAAGLVVKISNPEVDPEGIRILKQRTADYPNIFFIEGVIGREEVNALLHSVDCFISLHRSEGFGLGLAEAMYLGKPVIGTGWSGNTDFMNADNSCPVQYELKTVGQDYGLYKAHQIWANPDIGHAAYYMKKLVNDREWALRIGLNGQTTIHTDFSPNAVGMLIKNRLESKKLL
ncbi:glycosyltransferase family 4 protein [Paenibacillus prosopidis]|uniref:Glycosyltransferase involved in cell wall biosynthesis n=1 Tax=Paenibacillus prosopidis TaxID=630520 RepID=A0A368W515_9BACL|nr:glycosyltransferase family 4 protein [Paenibacillus prosopidis]RCW50845.1 glycosyltransferase involved in cell wall biosynthesis [Paenibacillus prosopidis]